MRYPRSEVSHGMRIEWDVPVEMDDGWTFGESGECLRILGSELDGSVLPDGSYSIYVSAAEKPRKIIGEAVVLGGQTTVGGEGGSRRVIVAGLLEDGDSGVPVADGIIGFLAPGTDAEAWWSANEIDMGRIHAFGTTGQGDKTALSELLTVGVEYPRFMVGPESGGTSPVSVVAFRCRPTPSTAIWSSSRSTG